MKTKIGVILAAMLATGAMAQMASNTPPPLAVPGAPQAATPPPQAAPVTPAAQATTNKPAPKTTAKAKPAPKAAAPKAAAKKAPAAPVVAAASFAPNETAVVNATTLNVRGQSHINSEIVTRLKKGDAVTVIKEVTLSKPKTDEPAKWAQIMLPAGTRVWVNAAYVDASGIVTAKKLHIRTGAGENYSAIGELQKGDSVKVVETKGDWKAIDSPTNAYGFVAAHMLGRKEVPPVIFTPPVLTTIPENTQVVSAPKATPTTPVVPTTPVAPPEVSVVSVPPPTYTPISSGPPPPRIVQREGIIGETVSIQAPDYYHIQSLDTGKVVDYLHSTSTNLHLGSYIGKTVLVSGEEELDERWPNTPVLTIKKIQVVK